MFDEMIQFAKETLEKSGAEFGTHGFPYRKRSEHIQRVFTWAKRLMGPGTDIDQKAVLAAAALHDIGYTTNPDTDNHARAGAVLSRAYLEKKEFELDFIEQVCWLIENHSHKELLAKSETPLELIILLEADLLDETGALSIVWNCMAEGEKQKKTFLQTMEHLQKYSCNILETNPMVTPAAKKYWAQKQELVKEFMRQFSFDLA